MAACAGITGAGLNFPVHAQALELPLLTGDDRLQLAISPDGNGELFSLCAVGRLGALGFDSCLELGPDSVRVTNPPMGRAFEISPTGAGLTWEELYGPRSANASLGTGGLTANVNREGRLTGLNWPGPGLYDHVNYLNLTQGWPNRGAVDNGGAFGGVNGQWLIERQGWRVTDQRYADPNTETLITELENDSGLRVTITDVVHPTADLLARNFRFSRPVDNFAYYANMNPTTARVPRIPSVFDAFLDPVTDFATTYDAAAGAMLHFRPYRVDPAAATRILTSQPSPALVLDALAGTFGPGVYIAVAGQGAPEQFQAGLDTLGLLRSEAEGTPLLDPFYDYADGDLSGSPFAAGKTAGGLAGLPADNPGANTSFTVYMAAAESPAAALAQIRDARQDGFAGIRAAAEQDWRSWIGRARLPATNDTRTLAVSKRALMAIRTARDRETGAIVANTTPQTPYRQDWIRDGAFFSYALLLAGYDEMAREHADFYRRIYRIGGTWDSFYYPDGAEGGAVFPYEIDTQGFAIWALWLPFAAGAADIEYLQSVYPAIQDTANALLLCTDPTSGLLCPAPEDDAVEPTQGAQGASAVYLAYVSATSAAQALGVAPNPAWAQRAGELRAAVLSELCNSELCAPNRGGIYLAWPARILDPADPETADLLQTHFTQFTEQLDRRSAFEAPMQGGFFQYPMESLMALGLDWQNANRVNRLDGWMRWLTHDVAEPGVLHFGERIFRDGERSYMHSVGFPHIWSGAETYIAAAHVYGLNGCTPGRDQVADAPCASSRQSGGNAVTGSTAGGGGCALSAQTSRFDPLFILSALLSVLVLCKRRDSALKT